MLWWQGWSEGSLRAMAHARLKVWCTVAAYTCQRQGGSSMSLQHVVPLLDPTYLIAKARVSAVAPSQAVLTSAWCSDEDQSHLVSHLSAIHRSAEAQLGAAPRSFLSCADLFDRTVVSKREQLLQQQKFLQVGVLAAVVCGSGSSFVQMYTHTHPHSAPDNRVRQPSRRLPVTAVYVFF
jgi:4-diphosphocytidyl-2C-methyl-D-erythritol kinase